MAGGSHPSGRVAGRDGVGGHGTARARHSLRCPPGAQALPEAPIFRPLPGAPAGLWGICLVGRRSAPVWSLTPAPAAWITFEQAGGPIIVGGDALSEPDAASPQLAMPPLVAQPLPTGTISTPAPAPGAIAQPAPVTNTGTYVLVHAGAAAIIPIEALEGIVDVPGLDLAPQPGMPTGALSVLVVEGRPALLLDPGWCTGRDGPPRPTSLLVVLHLDGRRFAVPVQQARPGSDGMDLTARMSDTQEGRALLAAAPAAGAPPTGARAEALQPLLICATREARFALPVAEIATVLAPRQPTPTTREGSAALRGVVAYRGEVLPVVDLDARLATPLTREMLALAPMLRLLCRGPGRTGAARPGPAAGAGAARSCRSTLTP